MSSIHNVHGSLSYSTVSSTARQPAAGDTKTTLTPARFSDMINSAIAAAVDTNGDGQISSDEYNTQIAAAGGSRQQADAQYRALDDNGDGLVSMDELAKTLKDPTQGKDREHLLQQLVNEIAAGQSVMPPSGMVLDVQGQAANPQAAMRYIAHQFPGNVNVV